MKYGIWFLLIQTDAAPANLGFWGPAAAVAILAVFLLAGRRGWKRAEAECGPGCICGGENLRVRQQATVLVHSQQQSSAPVFVQQAPAQPQVVYIQAQQQQPQTIYLQATPQQPQIVYVQTPQQSELRYLPAPAQPQYGPAPQQYHPHEVYSPPMSPQSYFAGPEIVVEEDQQRQLPPGSVRYLPPPSAQEVEELRRRFEKERKGMGW